MHSTPYPSASNASKHTPSIYRPWEPDGDTPAQWVVEDTDERTVVRDACGGLIADCTNGFHNDDGDWVMSAACGPLAHLIAAAPDLLKTLRAAESALRSFQYGNASEDFAKSQADACRAAIARAEGRA